MNKQSQEPLIPTPAPTPETGPAIALAAHPGDEVFGCGGALAQHARQGQPVLVVIAGLARETDTLAESQAAGNCLGYQDIRVWNEFSPREIYDEPAVQALLRLLAESDPIRLYAPADDEPDPGRAWLGLVAREAVRRSASRCQLANYELGQPREPNHILDITPVMELKRQAMACLHTSLATRRLDRQTEALNRVRAGALAADAEGAEGFRLWSAADIADRVPGLAARQPEVVGTRQERGPLVSILVRSAGRATLTEALDSIAAQSYRHIEVVLIDVRGSRAFGDIGHCGEFPLRQVSSGAPLGRGAAANLGLVAARGDLVLFLDDDDWLLPEHVAGLVEAIQSSDGALAAYAGIECRRPLPDGGWEVVHVFNQPHDPLRLLVENYLPIHAVLFSRHLVGDSLRFDETLEVYEDWDFWVQLSALTPLVHVDRVTAVYRIQPTSGFGVSRAGDELDRGLVTFFGKWQPRWTTQQLLGIVDYAKHRSMYQELRTQCADQHRTLSEQLDTTRFEREQWKIQHTLLASEKRALEEQIRGLHERILASEARNRALESARRAERELLDIIGIQSLRDAIRCRDELARHRSLQGRITRLIALLLSPLSTPYRQLKSVSRRLTGPVTRLLSHAEHLAQITRAYGPGPVVRALGNKLGASKGPGHPGLGTLWQVLKIAELRLDPHPQPQVALLVDLGQASAQTFWLLDELTQTSQAPPLELLFLHPPGHPIGALLDQRAPSARHLAVEPGGRMRAALAAALDHSKADWFMPLSIVQAEPRDWLLQLVQAAQETRLGGAEVGAIRAKLIGADGRLIEAGQRRAADGRLWPIGAGGDPRAPDYNYPRELDGASEMGLLLERSALTEALAERADTAALDTPELLAAMRARGRAILYQPDVTLAANAPSRVHGDQTPPDQRRLLVVDAVMLTPDQDSGSLRMYNLLEIFLGLGWHVTFVPSNLEPAEPYGSQLQRRGVEVLATPWIDSIYSLLQRRGAEYDLVILSRADVASQFIDPVKRYATRAQVWFDTVDLHFLREQREAELRGDPASLKLAAQRKRQELDLIARTDLTLVVSPIERELLASEAPEARLEILSNIHDSHPTQAAFAERDAILFIGGFNHDPNVDAVLHYVREILPLVESELGRVPTFIIGSRPSSEVLALNDPSRGLYVTGYVEDVTPYFERARLSIAPLRYGAGVKGKINMSMAYGVPVVATPCAAEGMSLRHETDILIGEDDAAFAAAVVRIYRDAALWETMARAGLDNIDRHFSRQVARATLERLLAEPDA